MSVVSEIAKLRAEHESLVTRHETERSVTDYAKYANDPEGFLREVLRCNPWSKQVEMCELARDKPATAPGVVVITGNGIGKEWTMARLALWWVYARRGRVVLTGPTERQVKQQLMREVRQAFNAAPELPGELYALELRVSDSCGIEAFTSDNPDRLTGYHHPRLLIAVTEAQGVGDEAFEAARACCTGPENCLFVYGNPTRPSGYFYRAATGDNSWSKLTIRADEHPNVVSGRDEIPGAVSREWIASLREEYGAGSSIYASRVLAVFPSEAAEGLVRREWLRAAFDRYEAREIAPAFRYDDTDPAGLVVAQQMPRLYLSLDVARYGPDSSVLAFVRGPVVEKLDTWRGLSITDSVDKVRAHADAATQTFVMPDAHLTFRPTIVVDDTGLGGGATDVLKQKGYYVVAFNGAAKPTTQLPTNQQRYLNARAEAYWRFRELLESGVVALPRDPLLEQEALAVAWQTNPTNGKIQILSKDLIRAELGRSPDRLDAVVMGLVHSMPARSNNWSRVDISWGFQTR